MGQSSRYPDMAPNTTIDFPSADFFGTNARDAMSGSSKAGVAMGQVSRKHTMLTVAAIIVVGYVAWHLSQTR